MLLTLGYEPSAGSERSAGALSLKSSGGPGQVPPREGEARRSGRRRSPGFRRGRLETAQRQVEPTSQQVRVRETPLSQSESYRLSPPRRGWRKSGPSDDQKC